jgi:hypothetical protein
MLTVFIQNNLSRFCLTFCKKYYFYDCTLKNVLAGKGFIN